MSSIDDDVKAAREILSHKTVVGTKLIDYDSAVTRILDRLEELEKDESNPSAFPTARSWAEHNERLVTDLLATQKKLEAQLEATIELTQARGAHACELIETQKILIEALESYRDWAASIGGMPPITYETFFLEMKIEAEEHYQKAREALKKVKGRGNEIHRKRF